MNNFIEKIPNCRICHARPNFQKLHADSVYGGKKEHNFWRCAECDAVYLFPVPSEKEEEVFYRQEFEKFMGKRSDQKTNWSKPLKHIESNQGHVKRRWKFLEPYLRSGLDLLEIGCSSGFMLKEFRDHGLNCTGVEPSGVFYDFLKSEKFEAYASIDELNKNFTKMFDLVVHFFVLEHIRDPFSFFRQSLDLLKKGGIIIAEVPCINDPLTKLYKIPAFEKFYWSIAHHYYYSPESLAYVMKKIGVRYKIVPEQRYDLSNHIVWMTQGKPGGQGAFEKIFSQDLIEQYQQDLKAQWMCDTMFLYVYK